MITFDFSQNLTIPHCTSQPSSWYFQSLIGVSMFGVHSESRQVHTNFIYSERTGSKGANEVISMLEASLRAKV